MRRGILLEYIMPLTDRALLPKGVASFPVSDDSLIYSPEATNPTSCRFILQSILCCQIIAVFLRNRDCSELYPNDVQFSLCRAAPRLISEHFLQPR